MAAFISKSSTVKTFTFTDKTQLTQHFNVSEFRARINDTATHLDNRTGSKWYGDETISSSKYITTGFYAYWGLTKKDMYGKADTAAPDTGTTDTPVMGTDTDNSSESKDVTFTIDGKTYTGSLKEK